MSQELADLLDELRQRSDRTYGALAIRTGVSKSALHRYCAGHSVPTEFGVVERIGQACGASHAEHLVLHQLWVRADARRRSGAPTAAEKTETEPSVLKSTAAPSSGLSATPNDPSLPAARSRWATLARPGLRALLGVLAGLVVLAVTAAYIANSQFGAFTGSAPAKTGEGNTSDTPTLNGIAHVEFVAPQKGLEISHGQDVVVSGIVTGLGSNTLWILSRHHVGGSFFLVTGKAGVSPAISVDGSWSVTDEGVGNPSDKGSTIVYYAVQANAECTQILSSMRNYDSLREPPRSCIILQGQRDVQIK